MHAVDKYSYMKVCSKFFFNQWRESLEATASAYLAYFGFPIPIHIRTSISIYLYLYLSMQHGCLNIRTTSPCKPLQHSHSAQPFSLSTFNSVLVGHHLLDPIHHQHIFFHFYPKHSFYLFTSNYSPRPTSNRLSLNYCSFDLFLLKE